MADKTSRKRVAIAGLGPIGIKVMQALDAGIDGLMLSAVAVGNPAKPRPELERLSRRPPVLPLEQLEPAADMVIECAPAALLRSIVQPFVAAGKTAVVLSAGALLEQWDLVEVARKSGGQIVVPTGALIGLDAVTAAAEGVIHSVRMVTRKPVAGLVGAPYLVRTASTSRACASRARCSTAPPGRGPGASRPTSMSLLRYRSPASAPTARCSRSGPTPRSTATPTASRSRPTRRASRCRSPTCRATIRRPAASPRCRSSPALRKMNAPLRGGD